MQVSPMIPRDSIDLILEEYLGYEPEAIAECRDEIIALIVAKLKA